jgi:hypothetical protein
MTPLPRIVRKGGFALALVERTGRVAIYRQHWPNSDPNRDAYEVILPQVRTTNHEGERVEPYEAFPSAESWGTKGWTFTDLDKAVQKLLQLTRKASRARTVSRRNRSNGHRSIAVLITQNRYRSCPGTTISRGHQTMTHDLGPN